MAFKNFDSDGSKKAERPNFEVAGQHFTCRAKLSFRKWRTLFSDLDEETNTVDGLVRINDFFQAVLLPGDRERFAELLESEDDDDDEQVLELQTLNDIIKWLMEHYSGNESEQPSI